MTDHTNDHTNDTELEALLAEMNAHQHPLTLVLRPPVALHIARLLQLALGLPSLRRAVGLSGGEGQSAQLLIDQVRAYFRDAPLITAFLSELAGCPVFRPDHNGECLNCDEWIDEHTPEAIEAGERRMRG